MTISRNMNNTTEISSEERDYLNFKLNVLETKIGMLEYTVTNMTATIERNQMIMSDYITNNRNDANANVISTLNLVVIAVSILILFK
jgi:hypothetical protein